MQGDYELEDNSRNPTLNNQLSEALADYFERKNNGEKLDAVAFVQQWPEIQLELGQALSLLQWSERVPPVSTAQAWQRFKGQVFTGQTAPAVNSLGSYVAQALVQNDSELRSTGLPRTTLEALSQDATPLATFQNYKFDDYAQLAKQYGVKDNLFPRVLKWFKSLSKSLNVNAGTSFSSGGYVFARDKDGSRELTEAELAQALENSDEEGNF